MCLVASMGESVINTVKKSPCLEFSPTAYRYRRDFLCWPTSLLQTGECSYTATVILPGFIFQKLLAAIVVIVLFYLILFSKTLGSDLFFVQQITFVSCHNDGEAAFYVQCFENSSSMSSSWCMISEIISVSMYFAQLRIGKQFSLRQSLKFIRSLRQLILYVQQT